MFVTLLIVCVSLLIFVDWVKKKRRYDVSAGIPGPPIIPIFGTYLIFQIRNGKDVMDIIKKHAEYYNGFARAWIFNKLTILMARPEELEIVLSSTKYVKKSATYNMLTPWLGQGLLTSSGAKWHTRRKVITPAFHFKILEQFLEIFDQQSRILVEQLKPHAKDQKSFDVYPFITLAALDVVCETAMGVKVNAQTDKGNRYVRAVTQITEIIMHRISNNFIQHELLFRVFASKEKRLHDESLKILHDFTKNVIQQRRLQLETKVNDKNSYETQDENLGTKRKMALLDILLQSTINGTPLTNDDIREEVDTFMFEGHDTTASGICYALYLISRHPDVQKKMVDEIRQVIGDDNEKPLSCADIQELKYCESVIKESMRMFPPVPLIGREFKENTTINGYTIPYGTELTVPIFIILRNPQLFPNPDTFNPDRFSSDHATERINPYAYIPFSAGPRNCIGQKFAMMEMKSTITKVLRFYELLPLGEAPDPVINLIMRSTNGVNMGIKPRVY